jgi:hypothetical protein
VTPNPLDDPAFFEEVMKIANAAADRVRESICQDWPRRSTKPDRGGRTASIVPRDFCRMVLPPLRYRIDRQADGRQHVALP